MSKPKIAFIVQRCGKEVIGGAESLCFIIAKKMKSLWNVEIITTCAIDYVTWKNEYPDGIEFVDGIAIRRFPVDFPRKISKFNTFSQYIFSNMHKITKEECEKWMRLQGPISSKLFKYVKDNKDDYDAFIFFTYLYATTYYGLQIVYEKAFLVPTAHDEWPIYLPIWDKWFKLPKAFVFNTPEEKSFLERRFPTIDFRGDVVGVGVEIPEKIFFDDFKQKYSINFPYVLYIGRIDESKGCGQLIRYFKKYKQDFRNSLKLVLIGKKVMDIPSHSDIIYLGPVSEEEKFASLAGCEFLVNPSPYESLSMVLLEAWSLNKPVLVNGHCEVLVGQCQRSNGGLWYRDYDEFVSCIEYLLQNKELAKNTQRFVKENYSWDVIREKYLQIVNRLNIRKS